MAKKISQFNSATTIKSGDISVVVQDGETKQFPLNLLATKAQADQYKAGVETQLADYEQEITDIKNQYDKELYTPTITVTNTSMVKTGQGDTVDYSASVEDGVAKSAILKGSTKYRDIYTRDILDTFDETKNLELVSVKEVVLTTTNEDGTKTNILSTSEDVELRGIGNVQDTLDCLTGEVTERIGEVVLDGSQNLDIQFNTNSQQPNTAFVQYIDSRFEKGGAISCNLPKVNEELWGVSSYDNQFVFNYLYYNENNKKIQVLIPYSMLKTIDINGVKQFLSENPIKILLPIKESIKTVDLRIVNQDNETLDKIKPFEGTMNINVTGNPINPIGVIEIPVEAITQNLSSFIEEE